MSYIILKDCKELLTIKENSEDLIGLLNNTSVLIKDEKIIKLGSYKDIKQSVEDYKYKEIDCSTKVVMPGYVDSHTHLIFGESRVDEYVESFTKNKDEIKKELKRVGLDSSIYSTKKSSDEELVSSSLVKLNRMLKHGTTTVEIKSGYGIDKETEIRLLRLLKKIKERASQTILTTYLGAHYWDTNMGKEKYIKFMIDEVMPVIKAENLADFSDVWCDDGYYTAEESEQILKAGIDYGMIPTMHTECYSAIGGAKVAANLQAANVGHLNFVTDEDIKLLSKAGVIGILLPGTDFSVKHPKPFDAKKIIEQGLEVAIATNLNPGNWVESMQMAIALACRNHNMTLNQAIKASTLGGAKALRISDEYGSIEVGKYADIQILNTETYKNIPYKLGVNEVEIVIKKGQII